jgi:hypothetical protein
VVPDLVRDDIRLREVSRRAELLLQGVVERQVDVDLLVGRTIERADRALREAAVRVHRVAEEDELGAPIGRAHLIVQIVGPHLLSVIEDERDELDLLLFGRVVDGYGLPSAPRREQVAAEHEAQNADDERAADAKTGDRSTAPTAPVFEVGASTSSCPSHADGPSKRGAIEALVRQAFVRCNSSRNSRRVRRFATDAGAAASGFWTARFGGC